MISGAFVKVDWNSSIDVLFNEIILFKNWNLINNLILMREPGILLKLFWAETYKFGCGVSQYVVKDDYTTLYVCEYGSMECS